MSEKYTAQQQHQIWLIFFFLGIVMLNFPFLQIFNRVEQFFGIPMLVLYLLVGWPVSIVVIFIFARSISEDNSSGGGENS